MKKQRPVRNRLPPPCGQHAHAVLRALFSRAQIRQSPPDHIREGREHIHKPDQRIVAAPRVRRIAVAHPALGPRDNERHTVAALVAGALVAAKRSRRDVAILLRAVVAGKNNDRVLDQLSRPAGADPPSLPASRSCGPICHVVLVDVVRPRVHRRIARDAASRRRRPACRRPPCIRRVRAVIRIRRIVEEERLLLRIAAPETCPFRNSIAESECRPPNSLST